jgi:hypothetical protein
MTKKYKLEVEVVLEEADENQAIQIARERYREVGTAEAPVDRRRQRWRKVAPEEWVQDATAAIMELIDANHLFEKAGIKVVAVSCAEPEAEKVGADEPSDALTKQLVEPRLDEDGRDEVDLDEPETGMYLCRWPNGDFSLVRADTRRQALVELDEWAGAHPSQLFPMETCMVDFGLNEQGEIEFKQFGEETDSFVWNTSYPELDKVLSSEGVLPEPDGECTPAAKVRIRQAVERERTRLWENQPECPQAETEMGRTLQKRLRTVGPVADYYVQEMATRILKSKVHRHGKPN